MDLSLWGEDEHMWGVRAMCVCELVWYGIWMGGADNRALVAALSVVVVLLTVGTPLAHITRDVRCTCCVV